MKIILTETQFNVIRFNEEITLLNEAISTKKHRINNIIKQIKRMILLGMTAAVIVPIIYNSVLSQEEKEIAINALNNMTNNDNYTDNEIALDNSADENKNLFDEKVLAVKDYMETALRNQNYSLEDTQLDARALVTASERYNFDLALLMAAAHCESCFGATPRAQRTNSVYSVGCYDNGKNRVTYDNPNDSILGYINLLNSDYLVNGKTINDLLRKGCFVNKNGHRYASDPNYEAKILKVMNRIKAKYPILA